MRYTSFILMLAFAATLSAQEFHRVFSTDNNPELVVQNIVRYNKATKSKERIYINRDHCSYVVVRKGARYYNAMPGENLVESQPVQSQAAGANFTATKYIYFRGIFPSKEPETAHYALPLAVGDKINVDPHIVLVRNSRREECYTSFEVQTNDTVYAMRGGSACIVGDDKGVIINHVDETFAVYYHMRKALVTPGDNVEVGQPIGLAAGGKVNVSFLYLDGKHFKQKEVLVEYPYTHFVPQIWDGTQYTRFEKPATVTVPDLTDDLVTQDMTKAQKKRYLKNKNRK